MDHAPLWVFGYASLIWNPEFPFSERALATLPGYSRSFCMRSIHHRGTPDRPGLVLALDKHEGAECHGLAFQVTRGAEEATLARLRERELISSAYLEKALPVDLAGKRRITAVAYVIDPDHEQYCGCLPLDEQAEIIARATGGRGPNSEYLYNTASHLEELGIKDADLAWLAERVRNLTA